MNTTYRVLIIEDEPMIVENYDRALEQVAANNPSLKFTVDRAATCQQAYDQLCAAKDLKPYHLVFLDIRLPKSLDGKLHSGQDVGIAVRSMMPKTKIIVITSYDDTRRLEAIMNTIRPDSFLVKSDVGFSDVVRTIEKVLDHKTFYSNRILTLLKSQTQHKGLLDSIDINLLMEISNGSKMKELVSLLPLTKSGIEKRRTLIKQKLGDKSMSDRDMILIAKENGFI